MTGERDGASLGLETAASLLREYGIKVTAQRSWIAANLFARPRHVSADQLYEAAMREGRGISRATVYNTLNLFLDRGLLRQVVVEPNRVFYDSNTSVHYHVYNRDTGMLSDFSVEEMRLSGLPPLPESTVSMGVDVIVRIRNRRE